MMDPTDPKGPVYLQRGFGKPNMTYRQFVAALVLAGLEGNSGACEMTVEETATRAVRAADALIAELNKESI